MSFRIAYYSKRVQILSLFFLLSVFSGYANPHHGFSEKNSALSGVRFVGKQLYMTALWHDGSHRISFFLPKKLGENKLFWWDTGLLLGGTHFGYRQILTTSWLNQKWFSGIYAGFDVMSDFLSDITKLNLTPFYLYPTRLNLGFELSGARWGQVALDFYGEPYNPAASPVAKDYFGVSTKISFNHLPFSVFPRVKPFVGAACSWVGLRENEFQRESFYSFIIGSKYIVNSWLDFEGKYVYDHKGYQKPINFGFQIKFDGIDSHANYFEYLYSRPPGGYKPHYADSSQLAGLAEPGVNPAGTAEEATGNTDASTTWQLAVNGKQRELAARRNEQIQENDGTVTLSDGSAMNVNPNVFNGKAIERADVLSEMDELYRFNRIRPTNILRKQNNHTSMVIEGAQPTQELSSLLNSREIPLTPLITVRDVSGNRSGVGIYGSTAALLYSFERTARQIAADMHTRVLENFATVEISHTDAQGNQQDVFLLCPVTGVQAEQRAVREGLLPPDNVAGQSASRHFLDTV